MIRLRDETSELGPALTVLNGLLGKVERLPRSAVQRRRVWLSLTRPAGRSGASWRGARFVLAAALAATAASASIAQYWPEPRAPEVAQQAPVLAASTQAAPASLPKTAISEPTAPEPVQPALPQARKVQRPQSSRADLEATLMLEALRTRNSGDAARVGKLAEEYQRKHPNGPLQEEALALSLEAAAARRDASAVRLARDYLRRYPNGRFQAQAARVLRDAR